MRLSIRTDRAGRLADAVAKPSQPGAGHSLIHNGGLGLGAAMLAATLAFASGSSNAANPLVELETVSEIEPAKSLCTQVKKMLKAFAASPAAQRPVCEWRPLQFAKAGDLAMPEWTPAGDYVRVADFPRRFLDAWLDVLVANGGKPTDVRWREEGYARVLADRDVDVSWQEARFAVEGDRREKRWLRMDIADCSRYPDTFVSYLTLPKIAAIAGTDVPAPVSGQMLGSAFSSDDVFLYQGKAYDLALSAAASHQGATLQVQPLRLDRLDLATDDRTLMTRAPLCYFKLRTRN